MYFDELDLEDEVLDGLEAMNFFETTPVQEATIPLLLEGRDMIACAQTGTGKTAAYLLPIINRLSVARARRAGRSLAARRGANPSPGRGLSPPARRGWAGWRRTARR